MNYKYVLCVFAICSLQGAIQKSLFELQGGLSLFSRAVAGYPGHSFPEPAVKGPNLAEKYRTFIPVFVEKLKTINLDQLKNAVMDSIDLKDSLDNNMSGLRDTALNCLIEITNSQIGLTNFKALERAVTSAYPVQIDKKLLDLFRPAVSELYNRIRDSLINELKLLYYITELSRKLSEISDLDEFFDFPTQNVFAEHIKSKAFFSHEGSAWREQQIQSPGDLTKTPHTNRVAQALKDFDTLIDSIWKKMKQEKKRQAKTGLTDVGRKEIADLQKNEKVLNREAWVYRGAGLESFLRGIMDQLPSIQSLFSSIKERFAMEKPDFSGLGLPAHDIRRLQKLHNAAVIIWKDLQNQISSINTAKYDLLQWELLKKKYSPQS